MYRTINCDTWGDPWFEDLPSSAKLLFLYFITNRRTTASGCIEVTRRAMMFETGLGATDLDACLQELEGRIVWWPDHQVIFVRNFYKHQRANSNKDNFRKAALKSLAEFPSEVRARVGDAYPELQGNEPTHPQPIPNPSPTHRDKETVTGTDTETASGTETEANARAREASKPQPSKPKPSEPDGTPPFEYIVAMCEATTTDVAELSPAFKSKQLGAAKQLRDLGCSPDDAQRCIGWCQSQNWRNGGIDLFTVVKEFPGWLLLGKPATAKQPQASNGRASPQPSNGDISAANIDRALGLTPQSDGPYIETTGRIAS